VRAALDLSVTRDYVLVEPLLPCAAGAVLMALRELGLAPGPAVWENLRALSWASPGIDIHPGTR
jgi:hypothetical protein